MRSRIPIRWKVAILSAGLTFAILCGFAIGVGELTQRRIRDDFVRQTTATADQLGSRVVLRYDPSTSRASLNFDPKFFRLFQGGENATVRVVDQSGHQLTSQPWIVPRDRLLPKPGTEIVDGYRVETRQIQVVPGGIAYIQYARPLSALNATLRRVRLFLLLGVLGGTALALAGGLLLARRAMRPIVRLTDQANEIRRTRDPGLAIDAPPVEDEVGDLARAFDAMLESLDEARGETEAALERQRAFVADASHELRTPLTSVLANLELLAETLHGDQREAAESALRSSQRMRRLVADLLLLARADARREAPHRRLDLGPVLVEAAAEVEALGPDGHEISVEAEEVHVDGVRDDLLRVTLNLMENALRHTPSGTRIRARVTRVDGDAVLVVEDDGPGIPPALRARIFDRFVRGEGDRGGSFGLGLSIVRAVAEQHGGSVSVEDAEPGARFVVRLPAVEAAERAPEPAAAA